MGPREVGEVVDKSAENADGESGEGEGVVEDRSDRWHSWGYGVSRVDERHELVVVFTYPFATHNAAQVSRCMTRVNCIVHMINDVLNIDSHADPNYYWL